MWGRTTVPPIVPMLAHYIWCVPFCISCMLYIVQACTATRWHPRYQMHASAILLQYFADWLVSWHESWPAFLNSCLNANYSFKSAFFRHAGLVVRSVLFHCSLSMSSQNCLQSVDFALLLNNEPLQARFLPTFSWRLLPQTPFRHRGGCTPYTHHWEVPTVSRKFCSFFFWSVEDVRSPAYSFD